MQQEKDGVIGMAKKNSMKRAQAGKAAVGGDLSFAAREAYKRLRTNLILSLPDSGGTCQAIGVAGAVAGEGSSTTAMNLAASLALSGRRVLLLEGDMRCPTAAQRLGLSLSPGLSGLLAGTCSEEEAVQASGLDENLFVIAAGEVPPNPSELLACERMSGCMQSLRQRFEYIVLDLPPVTAVTDAVVSARLTDGLVMVVRNGSCSRSALQEALRQLSFADVKLLGFVTTFNDIGSRKYAKCGYGEGNSPKG